MLNETGTYDTDAAKNISLKILLRIFGDYGCSDLYIKKLSPNDNSKNQPYFSSHLTDLSFIPTGEIEASETRSRKKTISKSDNRRVKYQASLDFQWIDAEGHIFPAKNTKLIYYPQYPEVRFSGFILGSGVKISRWMDPNKNGREHGRWLVLGVGNNQKVLGYLVTPEHFLANELNQTFGSSKNIFNRIGIERPPALSATEELFEIPSADTKISTPFPLAYVTTTAAGRDQLKQKLINIHNKGWIDGAKLDTNGNRQPYNAPNAAGYTLEAEFGIKPNGNAQPDFQGWELKQFGVKSFPKVSAKPTTLLTPEPNGGTYIAEGIQKFMRQYGYDDKNGIDDRLNFGGRHICDKKCSATDLTLVLQGFDKGTSEITKATGSVCLIDDNDNVAAEWTFAKLMNHWKTKHNKAAYIPCITEVLSKTRRQYKFGNVVELGEGTTFQLFLSATADGLVYYDPGIKIENATSQNPKIKKRSQFRIAHKNLSKLYQKFESLKLV